MQDFVNKALVIAQQIQDDVRHGTKPPIEGGKAKTNQVIDFALVRGTRGYLEKVVNQINGTYEHGWYDACAVMLRRLMETLIIESYENVGAATNIKNSEGDYPQLSDLIKFAKNEPAFGLSRNAKKGLDKLKNIADQAAHSRRFNANRNDIESILPEIRTLVQEFVSIARYK